MNFKLTISFTFWLNSWLSNWKNKPLMMFNKILVYEYFALLFLFTNEQRRVIKNLPSSQC